MKAHQRILREEAQSVDPRAADANLSGARVSRIDRGLATPFIVKYEWLRTMPTATRVCYGLFNAGGELMGVSVFGNGGGSNAANLCGEEFRHRAICLERGACAHFAPKNASSFLISRSCALAHKEHGWCIFYAYADALAGEIGQVYQAANWHYIGFTRDRSGKQTTRNMWKLPIAGEITSKAMRSKYGSAAVARANGLSPAPVPERSRYVWFEGHRRSWLKLLRYPIKPYPKRPD